VKSVDLRLSYYHKWPLSNIWVNREKQFKSVYCLRPDKLFGMELKTNDMYLLFMAEETFKWKTKSIIKRMSYKWRPNNIVTFSQPEVLLINIK